MRPASIIRFMKNGCASYDNRWGKGSIFSRYWAPNAMRVSAVGDFNGWDGRIHQMRRLGNSGIFEIFVPDAKAGQNYKYEIKVKGGLTYLKADPYAFGQQLRPDTASVIRESVGKEKDKASGQVVWEDQEWSKGQEGAAGKR